MKEKEMMATMSGKQDEQRMTSLDIAAVTGKLVWTPIGMEFIRTIV